MNFLWNDNAKMPSFDALDKDIETDVLIIGGGLCGILCAYQLGRAGIDYVLLEGERIGSKTTLGTSAKITSQHSLIYSRLIKEFDTSVARLYYEANEEAINAYARLCEDIDCDFERASSYIYSLNDKSILEKELSALEKISARASLVSVSELPFKTQGAIKFENQAHFNPLKLISHLSRELNIYEGSYVRELINVRGEHPHIIAKTDKASVKAKKVIVATHFPIINKHGFYFLKMFQERSYVLSLEGANVPDGMYLDASGHGFSFRRYGELLLLGGGAHRTGKNGTAWKELEELAKRYYPNAKITHRWATQDCITLDGMPYIGKYSPLTPNLYVATGFNKWGMTSSMIASEVLCDMICKGHSKYEELFSPSRRILRTQLATNTLEALKGWLTIWEKKCPHLGCSLKWNKYEHSWDCPCHGSRFDADGKLLNNPATGDLKDKK